MFMQFIYWHSYKSPRALKVENAHILKARNDKFTTLHNCEDGPCKGYVQNKHAKVFSHHEGKLQYLPHIRKLESGKYSINDYYNGTSAIDIERRQQFAFLPPNVRPLSYILWMLVLDEPEIIGNVTIRSKVVR
mgnify:CR=1 FL=1